MGKDKLATLTSQQLTIVGYVKEKKEVTAEGIMEDLQLSEKDFKREFAVLRHMEVLAAMKKEGKVFYILFNRNHG